MTADEFEAAVEAECAPPFASKLGGKFIYEIASAKPKRDWLLKNVFLSKTLNLVVGSPGCGKSFLLLDMCMTMAHAVVDARAPREWFCRKIKPCGVVYVAAEGQDDFLVRIYAWLQARDLPFDTPIPVFLIPTAIDMRQSDADTNKLIDDIRGVEKAFQERFCVGVGLVVIDTFNRALAGGDDTKSEHVGAFIKHSTKIREATGVTVIPVCHTAKNSQTTDPRGHGSVRGDNDGEVFVKPAIDGAPNEWRVTRQKAAAVGDRFEFRLRQIKVGVDEDGDDITSCYVIPGASEAAVEGAEMQDATQRTAGTGTPFMTADGRAILHGNSLAIMRALHKLLEAAPTSPDQGDRGDYPPPRIKLPFGRSAVKLSAWTDEIVRTMPGDDKSDAKFKDRCRKARDAAAVKFSERGLIQIDGDWVWRTSRKIAGVDKRPEPERREPASESSAPSSGIEF